MNQTRFTIRRFFFAVGVGFFLLPVGSFAQTAGPQIVPGSVPAALGNFNLQPLQDLPATNQLNLAIGLPLRNQAALDQFLQQLQDPASANYHHYLTPQEFTEQFGPSPQDYDAVVNFAKTQGLSVTGTYSNRALVDVSGDVETIEKAFHVKMHTYRHPTENRNFFAPDTEPSVDLDVPILHISGLNNFFIPRPALVIKTNLSGAQPASGSGPSGSLIGADFRNAYIPGVTLNGSGQTVGLFELDGYYPGDITTYENDANLPHANLMNVLVDGYSGAAGSGNVEVALDIEMVVSMATNLNSVVVYETQNGGIIVDLLNRIASDNIAKQISSSWLIGDDPGYDVVYQQMAAQGQSFFQASGDNGAFYKGISEWADDTNITLVGGTTLAMNGSGSSYKSETVWNWYSSGEGSDGGGGGVNFNNVPIPSYQNGINLTAAHGSSTLRNVPDVAMNADNVFVVADNGLTGEVGGTSAASPLWAGFLSLVNQQAQSLGNPPMGFINPAIYALGESANYTANFHDITVGNNTNLVVATNYFAVPGFDLCTGWGTPNGLALIKSLTPASLVVQPTAGLSASGPIGGPFSPGSGTFLLINADTNAVSWSLTNLPPWLTVSATNGTVPVGATNSIQLIVNAAANVLSNGYYSASLLFSNANTMATQSRTFSLLVYQPGAPLLQNGGFETGDLTGWILNGNSYVNTVSGRYTYNSGTASNPFFTTINPHSGNYEALLGQPHSQAFLSQNIPTAPGQLYILSLWMDSPDGSKPNEFSVAWNGNSLYDRSNLPKLGWTKLTFVVTASGGISTLAIGGRDDPTLLGLDDVSLVPVPPVALQTSLGITPNRFTFSWTAMTNLAYQVQSTTNLSQPNWVVLRTIMPTNSVVTFTGTNSAASSPQTFYRLMVSQ